MIKQKWIELKLYGNQEDIDILMAYFNNEAIGSTINDNFTTIYFNDNMKKKVNHHLKLYNQKLNFDWNLSLLEQENWHLSWRDNFYPVKIGKKIIIIPSWDKKTKSEVTIRIEPGMAFGTGHHQTTFLAIKLLEDMISTSSSVLDLGTGSGILAITSKMLGAKNVDAVEIDHDCIENFQRNIELNDLQKKIDFYHYDVLMWDKYNYDIIVANINKNIILELIPNLKNSKSQIILTGLLNDDYDCVIKICEKNNLKVYQYLRKDEWIALKVSNES